MSKHITLALAVIMTALAVALAVASSTTRATALHAQALLAGLSVAVVLAVHLAPALLRSVPRLVLWPVWSMCLAAALWAHASFLIAAGNAAAATATASSPATAARAAQREQIGQVLSRINDRPAAQIARQLSWTTDPARTAALQVELQEARRADALREQLIVLAGSAAADATATADPVSRILADSLKVPANAVQLAGSLVLALLLEVLGMLLWREALGSMAPNKLAQELTPQSARQLVQVNVHQSAPDAAHYVQSEVPGLVQTDPCQTAPLLTGTSSSDLARLRQAIERGECRPTLASIRRYMRCGQGKAVELRGAILAQYREYGSATG